METEMRLCLLLEDFLDLTSSQIPICFFCPSLGGCDLYPFSSTLTILQLSTTSLNFSLKQCHERRAYVCLAGKYICMRKSFNCLNCLICKMGQCYLEGNSSNEYRVPQIRKLIQNRFLKKYLFIWLPWVLVVTHRLTSHGARAQ